MIPWSFSNIEKARPKIIKVVSILIVKGPSVTCSPTGKNHAAEANIKAINREIEVVKKNHFRTKTSRIEPIIGTKIHNIGALNQLLQFL
jgi:hypothetical protein